MPKVFDFHNPPFDRLTPQEAETVRAALDIGYFKPGETIIGQDTASEQLFVVIKGQVQERDGTEILGLLGPKDSFDARALVHGRSGHGFTAGVETLLYMLPKSVALSLIRKNPRFAAFFYLEISKKLDALIADDDEKRTGSLMRSRIKDVFLQPAVFIDADDTIETAGHRMQEVNSNALFVRDGDRVGIITGMNLSKEVVLRRKPISSPVRASTHFDLVSLQLDDFVYSALLAMTKHNKRRVAVHDGLQYVGILENIDLLSFIGGSAQLIAGRIALAGNIEELCASAKEIDVQVRMLRRQGLKVEVIAEIVSDLNRRLMAKLFDVTAPEPIRTAACLIVMGSEGRAEQTLRTDQDNGLILANAVDPAVLDRFRGEFTRALEGFGFPPCPGNIIVQNPRWSKPAGDYIADFRRWIALPDDTAHMNVAIFYDAAAIAGDLSLLARTKQSLIDMVRGEQAYMAHFARAVDAFQTPIGFFNQLITSEGDGDALDLKKGGIFPIVHGIRSLAIQRGLVETSTNDRMEKLVEGGDLSVEFGHELNQALHFLVTMKLDSQLAFAAGGTDNLLRPSQLTSMERDLLRDAFQIVKQFREIIRRRFNLGMF